MSDEVPDSAGGAVRAFLGALGFIVALVGAEMIAEKDGQRFWIGVALVAASLLIFFSSVAWKWFRRRVGKLFADRLIAIANDPRWWIISFFLALFSMRLVMFGRDFPLVTGGIIVVLMCFIVWGYFATRHQAAVTKAAETHPEPAATDGQVHLDLVHLLDFAVNETTARMLSDLINLAPRKLPPDEQLVLSADSIQAKADADFVRHVASRFGHGTHRYNSFRNWLADAEFAAEQQLEATPESQRPQADPLLLRRHAIANLQFIRTMQFLRIQLREIEEKIIQQRNSLLERLRSRSPN